MLATSCPKNTGKIETMRIDPERIRLRVETPSQNIASKAKTCGGVVIGPRPWTEFNLIRQAAGDTAAAAAATSAPASAGSRVVADSIAFEVVEAKAAGSAVTLQLTMKNEGDISISITLKNVGTVQIS